MRSASLRVLRFHCPSCRDGIHYICDFTPLLPPSVPLPEPVFRPALVQSAAAAYLALVQVVKTQTLRATVRLGWPAGRGAWHHPALRCACCCHAAAGNALL